MKKILFVCDGSNFSLGAFEFIKQLNSLDSIFVKGIFFQPTDLAEYLALNYSPTAAPLLRRKGKDDEITRESEVAFGEHCRKSGIRHGLGDLGEEWSIDAFVKETRFADLAVMSAELFAADLNADEPNIFMQDALHGAECPIVLVPENFHPIERLVIAHDGKKDSAFALKQFCNILSPMTELPTELVYAGDEHNDSVPEAALLKEYARLHFESLGVSKLQFDAKKYFLAWASEKKNILLICGSYGRSAVSNFLKSSFAREIITEHRMPVFIAHAG